MGDGASLNRFLETLVAHKIIRWGRADDGEYTNDDRYEASLNEADVVSSRTKHRNVGGEMRHQIVLDIDREAWLVKSSTPGHYHLYIDVPGGVGRPQYMNLLDALADCGVIEEGYARVSRERGFTSVRLPWIKKGAR